MFEVEPTPFDKKQVRDDFAMVRRVQQLEALLNIVRPWIKTNQNGYYRLGRSPLFYDENQIAVIKEALGDA